MSEYLSTEQLLVLEAATARTDTFMQYAARSPNRELVRAVVAEARARRAYDQQVQTDLRKDAAEHRLNGRMHSAAYSEALADQCPPLPD